MHTQSLRMTSSHRVQRTNKQLERTQQANRLADRQLVEKLEALHLSEKTRLHEIRTENILLKMELRDSQCRELITALKRQVLSYNDVAMNTQSPKRSNIRRSGEERIEDNKSAEIDRRWKKLPILSSQPRMLFQSLPPNPRKYYDDGNSDSDASLSSFYESGSDDQDDSDDSRSMTRQVIRQVREAQTAPTLRRLPKISAKLGKLKAAQKNKQTKNEMKVGPKEPKKRRKSLTWKDQPQYKKLLESMEKYDHFTDGSMALAMRRYEHKRKASLQPPAGHLPVRRRRSISNYLQRTKSAESDSDKEYDTTPFTNKPRSAIASSGEHQQNEVQSSPDFNKGPVGISSPLRKVYIPQQEQDSAKKEYIKNISKLCRADQIQKYNRVQDKIREFLGGKLLASVPDLEPLTAEEQSMLTLLRASRMCKK
ncbi:uncharacterized protein LOC106179976 [Lingula anatina]|uniref:Uncharacterized protein LOC106179976 n=1 Tax=Lingula anatina TaxID=7574 RepID=A0A1S3K9F5_LINAN|nr:uncharacterized protein LOC106179976 [Lingula anatina]|eukprot:XP_013419260.1 uncharacterized protein LOC106179976 [Lingula anatina]